MLGLPQFPPTEPGQFVQVACRDLDQDYSPEYEAEWEPGRRPLDLCGRELMSPLAMLRRPFSLAGRRDTPDGVELDLIHRVVGVGTDWMSKLKPGDRVHVLGPLGNQFALPPEKGALLVGGGVGIPPMLYLAARLVGRRAVAFCGALTRDLLPFTVTNDAPAPDGRQLQPALQHRRVCPPRRRRGHLDRRRLVRLPRVRHAGAGTLPRRLPHRQRRPRAGRRLHVRPRADDEASPTSRLAGASSARSRSSGRWRAAWARARAAASASASPTPPRPPLPGRDWSYRLACTDGPVFRGSELLW